MFPNRVKAACALGIALALFGLAPPSALAKKGKKVKALVQIIDQEYCYADHELFLVSLFLEITVINSSSKPIYFKSDFEVGTWRIAENLKEAHSGNFFQDISPTMYPGPIPKLGRKIRVEPKHFVVFRIRHSVFGRYNATPEIPGSVPAGAFALQIVIYSNSYKPPSKKKRKKTLIEELPSITTEPFLFQVPKDPKINRCK